MGAHVTRGIASGSNVGDFLFETARPREEMRITFTLFPLPGSVTWLHLTAEEAGKCSPAVFAGRKEIRFVELSASICHSVSQDVRLYLPIHPALASREREFQQCIVPMKFYYLNWPGNKIYSKTDGL